MGHQAWKSHAVYMNTINVCPSCSRVCFILFWVALFFLLSFFLNQFVRLFSCSWLCVDLFVVMFFKYFNIRTIFCSSFSTLHHQNSTRSEVRRNNTTCFLFFCQSR